MYWLSGTCSFSADQVEVIRLDLFNHIRHIQPDVGHRPSAGHGLRRL